MKIWVTAWSLCNSAMLLTWNVLHPLTIIHHILWNVKYATGNHPDTTVTILFKGLGFDRRTPDTRFRVSGILAIIYQVSLYVTTNKQLSHKLDTDMPHCAGRKKKKKSNLPLRWNPSLVCCELRVHTHNAMCEVQPIWDLHLVLLLSVNAYFRVTDWRTVLFFSQPESYFMSFDDYSSESY